MRFQELHTVHCVQYGWMQYICVKLNCLSIWDCVTYDVFYDFFVYLNTEETESAEDMNTKKSNRKPENRNSI